MVLTKATKNVYTLNKRSFLLQPIPFIHAFLAPFISTSLYLLFMYIFLSLYFSHSLYVIFFFVHSLYILLFYCLSFSLSLSLYHLSLHLYLLFFSLLPLSSLYLFRSLHLPISFSLLCSLSPSFSLPSSLFTSLHLSLSLLSVSSYFLPLCMLLFIEITASYTSFSLLS